MDNKERVQNDIEDAQDKVQKPQQNLKDEIKNLNKDIVKFTELKNEKESELDNLLNLQITLQNEYAKLVKEGRPLNHLNVEMLINEINDALETERSNIKNLAISNLKKETVEINKIIDDLFEKFKEEDIAYKEFNEKKDIIINEFLNYDKELVKINNNIARFNKIYVIDEDHAQELKNIRNKVEDVSRDKRKLDQYMRNIEPYPYSELLNKLKVLENGTREISNRINSFNDYLISLKNDSETAYKNIRAKYDQLKEHELIIRELKVDKYQDYFKDRFDDCYALIDDISKLLVKVPIEVNQVNQYQRELNDKTNNLVKEIQDLNNYRNLASENILLINRDRMKFAEINNIVSQAETLYLNGDFKSAYDMTEQALNKLNFRDKQWFI